MIPVCEEVPDMGVPVIGHNPEWIDPDFNDRGYRECFRTGDGTDWVCALWIDHQDCYVTNGSKPTHWFPMVPRSQPTPVSVPEGWKLVPIEPTDDQIAAALRAQGDQINYDEVYAAMLTAAPSGDASLTETARAFDAAPDDAEFGPDHPVFKLAAERDALLLRVRALESGDAKPVPTVLHCPDCEEIHVDEGEWATRPHKTHQCQHCRHEWRPYQVHTVGVPVSGDAKLEAENKALRGALEPFVKLSEWAPVYEMITVNDMRQAAALLKDKSK